MLAYIFIYEDTKNIGESNCYILHGESKAYVMYTSLPIDRKLFHILRCCIYS